MEKYTYQLWTNDALSGSKAAFLKGVLSVLEDQNSGWQYVDKGTLNNQLTQRTDVLITLEDDCLTNCYPPVQHFKIKVYETDADDEHGEVTSSYGLGCALTCKPNTYYKQHLACTNVPKSKGFFPSIREVYPHHDAYTLGQSIARGLTDFVTVEKVMQE